MNKILLILLPFVLLPLLVAGQEPVRLPGRLERELSRIEEKIRNMDWDTGLKRAEKLTREYPEWPQSWILLAEIQKNKGLETDCRQSLKQAIRLDSTRYPKAYRWLAWYQFHRGGYPQASAYFRGLLAALGDTGRLTWKDSLLMESIQFAQIQLANPNPVVAEKLPPAINTGHNEYFPSLPVDGSRLVFTRQHVPSGDSARGAHQEDLYQALFDGSTFHSPQKIPEPINTPGNEGTQSLSQDGRIMVFTACNRPDSKGGCDIYWSTRSGDSWSQPRNLGYPVNSRYWESTPCLSPDGRSLYFSSNRPGGRGQMDIWRTEQLQSGEWTQPVNLGSPVNSPGNEMSPFMAIDSRILYFASDGHPGMGGFDLFSTRMDGKGKWTHPENLGYPINSFADEDGLTLTAFLKIAVFASGRDTLNGKDLYSVPWQSPDESREGMILAGQVTNGTTLNPLGAVIQIQSLADSILVSVTSDPSTGHYLAGIPEGKSFRINATTNGFLPYSGTVHLQMEKSGKTIRHDISLVPVTEGVILVLRNVFFRWDSYELLPESEPELRTILQTLSENPHLRLEIGGHTDSTGSDAYNLILSQQRAEAVCKYLINKGIDSSRLIPKGYGSHSPAADNLTEEGRRRNRRTEIKVLVR